MRLARITHWKQATGVAVGDGRATAVTVAALPGAPRDVSSSEAKLGEGGIAAALRELDERGALSGNVVVGIDPRSVFFMTRQRKGGDEIDVAQILDTHFAAARPDGGLVGDALAVNVRGGSYVALAACRKDGATLVEEGLTRIPHTRRALEPVPFAVFRLAQRASAAPRGWKTLVRVVIDGDRGLGLLQRGRSLLAWRPFAPAAGRELDSVCGVVRGLVAHARADLGVHVVDGAVLHGAPALSTVAAQASTVCGVEVRLVAAVEMSDKAVAQGLALGGLGVGTSAPNLLKQLRPPFSVREIFPYGTAAILAVVALGSWRMLASETGTFDDRCKRAQQKIDAALKASRVKLSDLKTARKAAMHEATLVSRFIGKRVPWAEFLRELPAHLPESAVLVGILGHDQLILPSLEKPDEKLGEGQREVSIHGQMQMTQAEAAPEDVKDLLAGVTQFPLLLANFPRVDGAEVTRHPRRGQDMATFIVRCGSKKL